MTNKFKAGDAIKITRPDSAIDKVFICESVMDKSKSFKPDNPLNLYPPGSPVCFNGWPHQLKYCEHYKGALSVLDNDQMCEQEKLYLSLLKCIP